MKSWHVTVENTYLVETDDDWSPADVRLSYIHGDLGPLTAIDGDITVQEAHDCNADDEP